MSHGSAAPLTLVSHTLCPYVQRAAIVLTEKGAAFERRWVDLANKPDWFKAISPLGKTPVLLVAETPIFESAVAWRAALASRASVQGAVRADYAQELNRFLLARKSALSRRIVEGTTAPR